jgi:hypothetical protein
MLESLRPYVNARMGVDELRRNADLIAKTPEAAFDNILHIELAPEFLDVNSFLLVGKCGVACQHAHLFKVT